MWTNSALLPHINRGSTHFHFSSSQLLTLVREHSRKVRSISLVSWILAHTTRRKVLLDALSIFDGWMVNSGFLMHALGLVSLLCSSFLLVCGIYLFKILIELGQTLGG
jgi:hypothetical protein